MIHSSSTTTRLFTPASVLIACVLCGGGAAYADDAAPANAEVSRGQKLYAKYCESCHGPNGEGDGAMAGEYARRPADLTVIARRDGHFPRAAILEVIDGRKLDRAHRHERVMPLWGSRFDVDLRDRLESTREKVIQARLAALATYLASIQKD